MKHTFFFLDLILLQTYRKQVKVDTVTNKIYLEKTWNGYCYGLNKFVEEEMYIF